MNGKNESSHQISTVYHTVMKGDGYINGYKTEKSQEKDKANWTIKKEFFYAYLS